MLAALYCRLSEEDRNKKDADEDSESIQNQKNLLVNYSLSKGWDIYKIYSDDDFSGSDRNRPGFNEMIRDAEEKKFDVVICKTQSRFSREIEIVEKYIHTLFPRWGIRFIGIVDNADTDVVGNKKSRQINGLVNEWYLEDLSANVRSVLNAKRKNGKHIGSFALYGYCKDPSDKNHLIIDEEAASVVRMVYELYIEGYGSTKIASILNSKGIPNPSTYKHINGSNYRPSKTSVTGSRWSYTTITAMLRNQMYAGDMVQGRIKKDSYKTNTQHRTKRDEWYIVPNTHEAIIQREQWQRVQKLLDTKNKASKSGEVHIFAGKAVCAECGKVLHSHYAKGIKYLRCPASDTDKSLCSGCSIRLDRLTQYVLEEFNKLCEQYFNESILENLVEINKGLDSEERELVKAKDRLSAELNKNDDALKNLYIDKLKGELTPAIFGRLSETLTDEKNSLEKKLVDINYSLEQIRQERERAETKAEIIERYRHFDEINRVLVEEFIQKVMIHKKIDGKQEIEIIWNL